MAFTETQEALWPNPRPASIDHHRLLEVLATTPVEHRHSWIELATVAHLLRPVPWREDKALTSLVASPFPTLTARAAATVHRAVAGDVVAWTLPSYHGKQTAYHVLVPTAALPNVQEWLKGLWETATKQVGPACAGETREAAARTMWRAALLVGSSNRRRHQVRVSVPSAIAMNALDDAARALGLRAGRLHRGQHHVVTIDEPDQSVQLLRAVGGGEFAEAWVRGAS